MGEDTEEAGAERTEEMSDSVRNRFGVFGGADYYPCGGFHDYHGSYATLDEATEFAKSMPDREWGWWHVFDFDTRTIAACGEFSGGYGSSPEEPPPLDNAEDEK